MTRFLDGPAARVSLMLRRSPLYLRVVEGKRPQWDALDQLDDQARPKETLHAYRRVAKRGHCHIKATDRSLSGWYPIVDYAFVDPQPADDVMRSKEKWRAWCLEQASKAKTACA